MEFIRISFLSKEIIALLLTSCLSLILFFSSRSDFVIAVEEDLADITSFIMYPQTWYKGVMQVKEENKVLKALVTQLTLLNSESERFRNENEHLKKMLQFVEAHPLSMQPANVVNTQLSSSVQTFFIDIGQMHGIHRDLPVIDMLGLLGKTVSLGDNASKIQLITDNNYRVSIRVGKDRTLGIFVPTHGRYGILEGVRKSLELTEGEIVVTSGISNIYPADIPVAKVISVASNNNQLFLDVAVEILADLNNLNYVFVIQ